MTDTPTPIAIYHNPDCGTSRNALAMIEAAGYVPTVVEYRTVGWSRPLLDKLLADMGATPRDVLREKGTPAAELGLLDPAVSDDHMLAAMVEHPILVNRPIVVTPQRHEALPPVRGGAGTARQRASAVRQRGRRGGAPIAAQPYTALTRR